ncbi:hypothetical protein LINPERHAP1_LOCUS18664 [Linum perenne]
MHLPSNFICSFRECFQYWGTSV